MTKTDTATVEALIEIVEVGKLFLPSTCDIAAATLRALAAERDKLRAENERLRGEGRDHIDAAQHFAGGQADAESDRDTWVYACNLAIQERMSAEAKVGQLREAVVELQRCITDQGFPYDGHMLTTCRNILEATK